MAKGKKGGKKGGKKKPKKEVDPNALTEVDKTFYELTITDLNRKLARYRTLTTELEQKNEEYKNELKKLEEDHNDVIIYMKRILQEKIDEVKDLEERLTGLTDTRIEETIEFQRQIIEKEEEYRLMHEQLTSEVKLLTGKLNSLEEFRLQREELMKKFEIQEQQMEEQEIRHKREIYEIERKFVIAKDKLKKDMEARLLQLSTEFQDVTEIRIASTTHRVIRENIAINNELDTMLATHQRLYNENKKFKEMTKDLKLEASLHEDEKKKAVSKSLVQYKLIERLTEEHRIMTEKVYKCQIIEREAVECKREIARLTAEIEKLKFNIRILEQNLHNSKCERTDLKTELAHCKKELENLSLILYESVLSIKEFLKLEKGARRKLAHTCKRDALLHNLLTLMNTAKYMIPRQPSMESVESVKATYEKGDLGFVPPPVTLRAVFPVRINQEAQVGPSFEALLAQYVPPPDTLKSASTEESLTSQEAVRELEIIISQTEEDYQPMKEEESLVFGEESEFEHITSSEEISYYVHLPDEPTREEVKVEQTDEGEQIEDAEEETQEPLTEDGFAEEEVEEEEQTESQP